MCSFDTEVRDKFYEHQCDPFFTGIDHVSGMDALAGPPEFEMVEYTPVEYEAVEYESAKYEEAEHEAIVYETIDYELFTR